MNKIGDCFYFGCHREAGHYLWSETARQVWDRENRFPFRYEILDGGLLPVREPQIEGKAVLVHIGTWTVVTFWDRSVDKRGGCNSSFVIPSHVGFDEAITISKERFPWVWARFSFEVVLSHDDAPNQGTDA